jgi:hypothetical protein
MNDDRRTPNDVTRPTLCAAALLAGVAALAGCGPVTGGVSHAALQRVQTVRGWQVYWVGTRFRGHPLRGITHDPGGAYEMQYGNCLTPVAGCPAPLQIVSTPDPTFVPGSTLPATPTTTIRGVPAYIASGGLMIHVQTGDEAVTVTALRAADALAAVQAMYALNNGASAVRGPLPVPQPTIVPPLDDHSG